MRVVIEQSHGVWRDVCVVGLLVVSSVLAVAVLLVVSLAG
jgi:hypothetical protein